MKRKISKEANFSKVKGITWEWFITQFFSQKESDGEVEEFEKDDDSD